jgi:hypothetical protein
MHGSSRLGVELGSNEGISLGAVLGVELGSDDGISLGAVLGVELGSDEGISLGGPRHSVGHAETHCTMNMYLTIG